MKKNIKFNKNINESSKELVNGPVNVVRMEGKIGQVKKIIYLFMDIHLDPSEQRECDNIRSIDIKNYFINNFDNSNQSNKIYDFLFEIKPTLMHKKKKNIEKGRYIDSIVKIFIEGFDIEKKKSSSNSKQFPNIRLHFVDIRDYLKHNTDSYMISLLNLTDQLWHSASPVNLDEIYQCLSIVNNRVEFLFNSLYNISNNVKYIKYKTVKNRYDLRYYVHDNFKYMIPKNNQEYYQNTEKDYNEQVTNIFNKLKYKYNNPNVAKKISLFINTTIKDSFLSFSESYKKIINIFNKLKLLQNQDDILYNLADNSKLRITIAEFYNEISNLYSIWTSIFSNIMDAYLLRRFLDQNKITNGIVYTGIYHSINYIKFFVKYFNFDITHFSYLKYNKEKVIDMINKDDIDINSIFYPSKITQCSDLSTFPVNFE